MKPSAAYAWMRTATWTLGLSAVPMVWIGLQTVFMPENGAFSLNETGFLVGVMGLFFVPLSAVAHRATEVLRGVTAGGEPVG